MRRLADEVGNAVRPCQCGICAYERGEQLSPRQARHLEVFVLDSIFRCIAYEGRLMGA